MGRIAPGVIVGWTGARNNLPTGWKHVPDLDGRYLKGANGTDPGQTGGATGHRHITPGHAHTLTHSHTTSATTGGGSLSALLRTDSGVTGGYPASHTHSRPNTNARTVSSGSAAPGTGLVSNDPAHETLLWIESDGTPDEFPAGCVTLTGDPIPPGWSARTGGLYLKGAASSGPIGQINSGSTSHSHSIDPHTHGGTSHNHTSPATGQTFSSVELWGGGTARIPATAWHTHGITVHNTNTAPLNSASGGSSGTSDAALPPYVTLTALTADTSRPLAAGIITAWLRPLAQIPHGWALCDGSRGTPDLRGRYVRTATNPSQHGTTGGSPAGHSHHGGSHSHTTTGHSHSSVTDGSVTSDQRPTTGSPSATVSRAPHTHSLSRTNTTTPPVGTSSVGTLQSTTTEPPYREVAFIMLVEPDGVPPDPPVLRAHPDFDADLPTTFEWRFVDPDLPLDGQSASQVQIAPAGGGPLVYDTGKVVSSSEYHSLPAGILNNRHSYRWRVKTWDEADNEGPYSEYATFSTRPALQPRAYNPTAPLVLGQEWVPIKEAPFRPSQTVERGYSFRATSMWSLSEARVYVDRPPAGAVLAHAPTISVYPMGTEAMSGPVRRLVIPTIGADVTTGSVLLTGTPMQPGATPARVYDDVLRAQGDGAYLTMTPDGASPSGTLRLVFAVGDTGDPASPAGRLVGKRILGVNLIYHAFGTLDQVNTTPGKSLQPRLRRSGVPTWLLAAGLDGPRDELTSTTPSRIEVGNVNPFWRPGINPTDDPTRMPWTAQAISWLQGAAAGGDAISIDLEWDGFENTEEVLDEISLDYAALEILYCEETRIAVGAVNVGLSPDGAPSSMLGRAMVSYQAGQPVPVPLAEARVFATSGEMATPELQPGVRYVVTIAHGTGAGAGMSPDMPTFRALRQLGPVAGHDGIEVLQSLREGRPLSRRVVDVLPQMSLHAHGEPQEPTVRDVTSHIADSTSYNVNAPAHQPGDLMIAFQAADWRPVATLETPTGGAEWLLLGEQTSDGDNRPSRVWWKVAGNNEPSSYVFKQGSGADGMTIIVAISGADTTQPPVVAPMAQAGIGVTVGTPSTQPQAARGLDLRFPSAVPWDTSPGSWGPHETYSLIASQNGTFITGALYASPFTSPMPTGSQQFTYPNLLATRHGFTVTVAGAPTNGQLVPDSHVYGVQTPGVVYSESADPGGLRQGVLDLADQEATYPQVRFWARRSGQIRAPLVLRSVEDPTVQVSLPANEFDTLPEIADGWREVNLRFQNGQPQFSGANAAAGGAGATEFTAPGPDTWIVPPQLTQTMVEAWGAGGPGAAPGSNAGAGGGGGGYARSILNVTPGDPHDVAVGAAEASRDSTFDTNVVIGGGGSPAGGIGGNTPGPGGGGTGNVVSAGGAGGPRQSTSQGGGGGGGSGSATAAGGDGISWGSGPIGGDPGTGEGHGGRGGNTGAPGEDGHYPGGGGGGRGADGGTAGSGADGRVRITPMAATTWTWRLDSTSGDAQWEVLGAGTGDIVGLDPATYGAAGAHMHSAGVAQLGADVAILFGRDMPLMFGLTVEARTQELATVDSHCPVDDDRPVPTGLLYHHITWQPLQHGHEIVHWGRYELQRQDDTMAPEEWETIAHGISPFASSFDDFEARIGVASRYRIRACNRARFCGPWSPPAESTLPAPGVVGLGPNTPVLVFTSNEQPGSNLAYAPTFPGAASEHVTFPEAGERQLRRHFGRDYQVAYRPSERGGEAFTRTLLVNATTIPVQTLREGFTSLRDLAWEDLPYVCVRSEAADRWLANINVPDGLFQRPGTLYLATAEITEVTGTPAPAEVDACEGLTSSTNLLPDQAVWAYAPDPSAVVLSGDFEIEAQLRLPDWNLPDGQRFTIYQKRDLATGVGVMFLVIAGSLAIRLADEHGAEVATSATVGLSLGVAEAGWVKASIITNNGAGASETRFWTSPDGQNWVQLGAAVAGPVVASSFDADATPTIGGLVVDLDGGAVYANDGTIMRVRIRGGIGGPVVAGPNFSGQPPGTTEFVDDAGVLWRVTGGGTCSIPFGGKQ